MLSKDEYKRTYDLDNDGHITDDEIRRVKEMVDSTNKDQRADSQRNMTWIGIIGMAVYPFMVIYASRQGFESAVTVLGDMASTYFVSVAGIVATFFGSEAYKKGK